MNEHASLRPWEWRKVLEGAHSCADGYREGTRSVRRCVYRSQLDVETLVCARGRNTRVVVDPRVPQHETRLGDDFGLMIVVVIPSVG